MNGWLGMTDGGLVEKVMVMFESKDLRKMVKDPGSESGE